MPQTIEITLEDSEYSDLQSIAEEMLKDPPDAAHDLLVAAIADRMAKSASARARSFNRGVTTVRKRASFADTAVAKLKQINQSTYPARQRRNL